MICNLDGRHYHCVANRSVVSECEKIVVNTTMFGILQLAMVGS